MTKTELYTNVTDGLESIFESYPKASKAMKEELQTLIDQLLKPKAGGGHSTNPPKLDKDGNIVEAYCRYHKCYEPVDNMVISNGKSKGYCKASISKWTKANKEVKAMEKEAATAILEGNIDLAKAKAEEAKELQASIVSPEFYDLEKDWEAFNA